MKPQKRLEYVRLGHVAMCLMEQLHTRRFPVSLPAAPIDQSLGTLLSLITEVCAIRWESVENVLRSSA